MIVGSTLTEMKDLSELEVQDITEAAKEISRTAQYIQDSIPKLINFGIMVVIAIVCFVIGTKIIGWIRKLLRLSLERKDADAGLIQFLDSLVKAILYVVLALTILQKFGVQTTSVVAIIGSAGVAIGLALQGSLSNFAGGVLILLLKPFKVGDYIVQGSLEGSVTEIQLFYTILLTPDNKKVVIPNGTLSDNSLINVSAEATRRIDVKVGIDYSSSIKDAKEALLKVAMGDESVLKDPAPFVGVEELASSEVTMLLRVWVPTENYWEVTYRMNEEVKLALDAAGISIPFNQLDVHLSGQQ